MGKAVILEQVRVQCTGRTEAKWRESPPRCANGRSRSPGSTCHAAALDTGLTIVALSTREEGRVEQPGTRRRMREALKAFRKPFDVPQVFTGGVNSGTAIKAAS